MAEETYLFLPIEPEWAIAMLNGKKKREFRSKKPSIVEHDVVVLYAKAPLQAVVGSFAVGELVTDTRYGVWRQVAGPAGLSRAKLYERFAKGDRVTAIQVRKPRRIDPFSPGWQVGQGWRFLDPKRAAHRRMIERIAASRR